MCVTAKQKADNLLRLPEKAKDAADSLSFLVGVKKS